MEPQKTNKDVMISDFSTIKTEANLKEAFEGIKKMLEKFPHRRLVIGNEGNYGGDTCRFYE